MLRPGPSPLGSRQSTLLGSLKEGLAECKVPFGQREIQQPQKPRILPYRRRGARYGAWHTFDKVTITPAIEVAKETVAPIMLPADGIDRVYRRRVPRRIAMAESTVVAVNRETQSLRRTLIVGRPDLGSLGGYRDGDFSQVGGTYRGSCAVALWVLG